MSAPQERAIRNDDIDISATSNSPNLSWRQKVSAGWEYVGITSIPSALTVPFISGSTRSLKAEIKPKVSFAMPGCRRGGFETRTHLFSIKRPDVVEQFHAAESVLARQLLKMRRGDVADRYLFGEVAVFFIRFRVDGEKADIVGRHVA